MNCESCGMPMAEVKDFGGGDANNTCCVHCCDEYGKLKSREVIRKNMAAFMMSPAGQQIYGKKIQDLDEALKTADAYMATQPAWNKKE